MVSLRLRPQLPAIRFPAGSTDGLPTTGLFPCGAFANFWPRSVTALGGASKELREAIKHQHLGQLHCSAAVSLVQQLAANTLAALPCPTPIVARTDRHAATQQLPNLHLPTALPFHLLLSLFASQRLALPRASLRLILFLCLLLLYYILGPWGTGGFTAAISRRFDLLQFVIPASTSLQCSLSLYFFPFFFSGSFAPWATFVLGLAGWRRPTVGLGRPFSLRCNSR